MSARHLLFALLLLAPSAAAAQPDEEGLIPEEARQIQRMILSGTMGETVIGMNFTLRGRDELIAAHYYRGRNPVDIPLRIERQGDDIALSDPDGGSFRLRLYGHADSPPPFGFDNSIGLVGAYARAGERRYVRLRFGTVLRGEAGGERWYRDVTSASDADYEAMVRRFLEAAIAGDRETAARAVSFPLEVNGRCTRTIRNRAMLFELWDAIFTPDYLARLRTAIPHEMFVRNGLAMVGSGDVWFNADGATTLNFAGCPVRRGRRPAS